MYQHVVGDTIVYKGQRYHCMDSREHTRLDGEKTILVTFHSWCADCGKGFEFERSKYYTKFYPNRRCPRHKAPLRRVKEKK